VDIVVKHMNEKVPSVCRLRPDLPIEMDQFMQKAMAKSPADRYSTPREFITAIEQLQVQIQAMQPTDRQEALDRYQGGDARNEQQKQQVGVGAQNAPGEPGKRVGGKEAKADVRQAKATELPPKKAYLLVLASGQTIALNGELMVVGRQDPVLGIFPEINLADKTVGRRHAYLRNQQGQYTVEDLNALNKTRLNGVVLAPHEERTLKDGDILRFGSVEVRFELR
jgi:serine/threonine-protein kinase